jgi:hypothetical protein
VVYKISTDLRVLSFCVVYIGVTDFLALQQKSGKTHAEHAAKSEALLAFTKYNLITSNTTLFYVWNLESLSSSIEKYRAL